VPSDLPSDSKSEFGNDADGGDKFSHFSGVNWKGLI